MKYAYSWRYWRCFVDSLMSKTLDANAIISIKTILAVFQNGAARLHSSAMLHVTKTEA